MVLDFGIASRDLSHVWQFVKFAILPIAAWVAVKRVTLIWPNGLGAALRPPLRFIAISSTLFFVLAIPIGSVDISDFWQFLKLMLLVSIPAVVLLLSGYIKIKWARISVKSIASVLLVPAGIFLLLLCLFETACTRRAAPVYSPDGRHVALVKFILQGGLGDDYGNVFVRRSWWPVARQAYSGLGVLGRCPQSNGSTIPACEFGIGTTEPPAADAVDPRYATQPQGQFKSFARRRP